MSMWGGRFEESMSDVTRAYTADTNDRRLLRFDIEGSVAHVTMLGSTGIISNEESTILRDALGQILEEEFVFLDTDEDVHSAVERRLHEVVGDTAGKLHTARSRNDQVAVDLRLYLRDAAGRRIDQLWAWVRRLVGLARSQGETLVPTYTHLQQAQSTSLGNHLLAYAWMAVRDIKRFAAWQSNTDESPLGAGASAGSSLPIDPAQTAETLGFSGVIPNTLDAVGSRDFVSEYVFCCTQAMVHLSRLAEEIVLWASQEFGWLTLGDAISTGSSALPHKRNPDIAELVRGRTATSVGDLTSILSLQKGLPLAYNRDLQEDKRIVFSADDKLANSLEAMTELVANVEFHPPPPSPDTDALGLAELLVGRGVPFREAHRVVGEIIKSLEASGRSLARLSGDELVGYDNRFAADDVPITPRIGNIDEQIADIEALAGGEVL